MIYFKEEELLIGRAEEDRKRPNDLFQMFQEYILVWRIGA
jgi:hypothetical protein